MKKLNVVIVAVLGFAILSTGCSIKPFTKDTVYTLDKTTIDSFSNIDMNIDVSEIDIIPTSDDFAIEYNIVNQDIDYSVKGDVLTIDTSKFKSWGATDCKDSYIKIYVPENSELTNIDCTCLVGMIRISDLTADTMTIDSSVADLRLENILVNSNLKIKNSVGSTDVNLANSDCSYKVTSSVGGVKINDNSYSGLDVNMNHKSENGPKVTINSSTGHVKLNY